MTDPALRILVVAYYFPPTPHVGSNRWAAMVKYLRRLGHDVTVLTTAASGRLPDDREQQVVRTPDLVQSRALRTLLRRPELPEPGGRVAVDKPPGLLLGRVIVPDAYLVSWVPGALRAARAIVRERAIDCVATTSAPDSMHAVGAALQSRGLAWLADFRDGWSFDAPREPFPTAAQRRLDRWLEAQVVRRADALVAISEPVADDFRTRLGADVEVIGTGWDPELDADVAAAEAPELDADRVNLVHTGRLTGAWGRHPGPLLEALRRLTERRPELRERVRLVLAGRLDTEEERLLEGLGLDGVVQHVGHLPRPAAAALQRRADALVLLTSSSLAWELPGKLFEYFAAARPILALAEGNESGRLVRETGSGIVVSPDDPEAIASAIEAAVDGGLERAYSPHGLERYFQPAPAEAMSRRLRLAVERRAAARGAGR